MLTPRSPSHRRQRWGLLVALAIVLAVALAALAYQVPWQPVSLATPASASALSRSSSASGRSGAQRQRQRQPQPQQQQAQAQAAGLQQQAAQPRSQRQSQRAGGQGQADCSAFEQLNSSAVIVVARNSEDTSWLDLYVSSIQHVVYQAADLNALHTTAMNKGNEAGIYLQYIVDFYDKLPDQVVFSHGNAASWHLLDKVRILRSLRWGVHGFANLRHANMVCPEVWNCHHLGFDWRWSGNWLHPRDWQNHTRLREPVEALHGNSEDELTDSWLVARNWEEAFLGQLGELPSIMTSPCCSEFVVTRERIRARPKAFYMHLRNWIYLSKESSFNTGKFLEHTWALIFGERALHMPIPECSLIDCSMDGGQVGVHGYGTTSTM